MLATASLVAFAAAYFAFRGKDHFKPPVLAPLKAPKLTDLPEFGGSYKDRMLWGSYRSGLYFGMRTRCDSYRPASSVLCSEPRHLGKSSAIPSSSGEASCCASLHAARPRVLRQASCGSTQTTPPRCSSSGCAPPPAAINPSHACPRQPGRPPCFPCRTQAYPRAPACAGTSSPVVYTSARELCALPQVRHEASQGDGLASYGWTRHDGRYFGTQTLVDDEVNITLSMVRQDAV
jgi:hypothetical protein